MKVIYTDQAHQSLDDLSKFLLVEQAYALQKLLEHRTKILDKADNLKITHNHHQKEEYLEHLGKEHKRAIEEYFKIVFKIEGEVIYVTDFFDTRQVPNKMKG